ncbi:MAG: cation:proton antiporter [Candidatus Aenigmarchaeota archaeon]|nr:cation:proton antiporter [Candidatus Aenigmarchaeota archaeon]
MALEIILLLDIALILLVAKIFGEIAERAGVSSLIGEVLAGILLGPILLIVRPDPFLNQLTTFGLLFLLFILGLNTNFDSVKKDAYKGSVIALIADGLSFVAGFAIGWMMFHSFNVGLLLGVAMLSTSTAITLRSLTDIGEVKTRVYELVLAVNMADEVIAILALSLFVSYLTYGIIQIWTVVALFFAVVGFFLVVTTVGSKAVSKFLDFFKFMRDEQIMISIPLVIVFIVSFISEEVGIAGVTGAFLAGVAMSKSRMTENIILPKIKIIGYGFFIPLFFAYSAVMFDLTTLSTTAGMIILLLAAGAITKIIGVGYFTKFLHFDKREQLLAGVSMVPRGEYSIILAQIGLAAGMITNQLYTIVMSFVILSILVTPLLVKFSSRHKKF